MEINLVSDTVTKPSVEMLNAMFNAKVGDDVFGGASESDPGSPPGVDVLGRQVGVGRQSGHADVRGEREAAQEPAGRRVERQSLHERGGGGDRPLSEI
mgnify:CR=1 FL=1